MRDIIFTVSMGGVWWSCGSRQGWAPTRKQAEKDAKAAMEPQWRPADGGAA